MELEWIVDRRTRDGDPLLIFGPLQVTTTLPHGTPEEVRAEVRWAMDLCRDKASLVFFTSNTINPDVPLENIRAFWQEVRESTW
jgi:uroporphyrinogen decarboxylase